MALVRCIFDANTGCLIEYNSSRPPSEGEIEAYCDFYKLPEYGLIYDFDSNTVREATYEEYLTCFLSGRLGSKVEIVTLTLADRGQCIRRRSWSRILWKNISGSSSVISFDSDDSIVRFSEVCTILVFCQFTLSGSARQFVINACMNGELFQSRDTYGLSSTHRMSTYPITIMMRPEVGDMLEFRIWSDRSVRVVSDPKKTFLRILVHRE